MKKRLFITTALMTAVLGCSLATGTYAWYAAASTGGATLAQKSASITTKSDVKLAAVELTGKFTVTEDNIALSDGAGRTYVWVNGAKREVKPGESSLKTYTAVTFELSAPDETDFSAIAGQYLVTVTPTGAAHVHKDEPNGNTNVYQTAAKNPIKFDVFIDTAGFKETKGAGNGAAEGSPTLTLTMYASVEGKDQAETSVVAGLTADWSANNPSA